MKNNIQFATSAYLKESVFSWVMNGLKILKLQPPNISIKMYSPDFRMD